MKKKKKITKKKKIEREQKKNIQNFTIQKRNSSLTKCFFNNLFIVNI